MQFIVNNNGLKIGIVKTNRMLKKLLIGTFCFTLLTATGCSKKEEENKEVTITLDEDSSYVNFEPTYKVVYEFQAGDTLTGVVLGYESDANKVKNYIDQILVLNHLENAEAIKSHQKITLVGVPEDELKYFGYSVDYSLFPPEYEIEDRIEFLKKAYANMYETEANQFDIALFVDRFESLLELYKKIDTGREEEEQREYIDHLLEECRICCDYLFEAVGRSFEFGKTAHPLSEAILKQEKTLY